LQELFFTMDRGEHGVNILTHRYKLIKRIILTILEEEGPCSYNYIRFRISDMLFCMFDGQVPGYIDRVTKQLHELQIIENVTLSRDYKIRIKRP
jgi:hypothetical protein